MLQLGGGARGSDHARTQPAGQLHHGRSQAAADGMQQHPFGRGQPSPRHQSIPAGQEGFGNRRGHLDGHAVGHRQHFILMHHDELGVGPAAHQTHDRVSDSPPAGLRATRFDQAGVLQTGDVRRPGWRGRVPAAPLQDVGSIEAGGLHPHPDLRGTRLGRRRLLQGENLGTTRSGEEDALHGDSRRGSKRVEDSRR